MTTRSMRLNDSPRRRTARLTSALARASVGVTMVVAALAMLVGYAASATGSFPYTGPSVTIPARPNNYPEATATVAVAGLTGTLSDVDIRFDGTSCSSNPSSTTVGLAHGKVAQLYIWLTSPSGTEVSLNFSEAGANLCQTRFDDEAAVGFDSVTPAQSPYTGSYRPAGSLSSFDGSDPNGTWTVRVLDLFRDRFDGVLRSFTLFLNVGGTPIQVPYAGLPVPIPQPEIDPVTATVPVSGLGGTITDVDLQFTGTLCNEERSPSTVGIWYPSVNGLEMALIAPSGARVQLTDPGVQNLNGSDLCGTTFTDEAGSAFVDIGPSPEGPYSGFWRPLEPLSAFDGEDPNGTWTLWVADAYTGETGEIVAFSIVISTSDEPATTTSTTLAATTTTTIGAGTTTTTTVGGGTTTIGGGGGTTTTTTVGGGTTTTTTGTPAPSTTSPGGPTTTAVGSQIPATGGGAGLVPIALVVLALGGLVCGLARRYQ